MIVAILFIAALLYKVYAIPVAFVFAFFVTRSIVKNRPANAVMSIALAWTVGLFTPLAIPAQSFFDSTFVPWHLAFLPSPPTPEFSLGAPAIAIVVSLTGSAAALAFRKR